MNYKEKKDIALNMSILMDSILDQNSSPEDVANCAIRFCVETLKTHKSLREMVEKMTCTDWDKDMAWYEFEKHNLR